MQKSEEGHELTWAVNVMAPFLLTSLLLDTVTERIVNVSSISAGSDLDFSNLEQANACLICGIALAMQHASVAGTSALFLLILLKSSFSVELR